MPAQFPARIRTVEDDPTVHAQRAHEAHLVEARPGATSDRASRALHRARLVLIESMVRDGRTEREIVEALEDLGTR